LRLEISIWTFYECIILLAGFTYRGLASHNFTPVPGVHGIQLTQKTGGFLPQVEMSHMAFYSANSDRWAMEQNCLKK
jgi:hypothetical protein